MKKIWIIELSEKRPFKRGCAHGETLKEELRVLLDAWKKWGRETIGLHLPSFMRGDNIVTKTGAWIVDEILMRRWFARGFKKAIPKDLRLEIEGVAAGGNVPQNFVYLINYFDDLFRVRLQQCSGFIFKDDGGNYEMAINLEYGILLKELMKTCIFRHTWAPTPFLSVGSPGYIGVLRGMNAEGVTLGYFTSHASDVTKQGLPQSLLLRQAISGKFADFKSVISEIKFGPRTIGSNVLVCSKDKAAAMELSAKRHRVRKLTKEPLIVTNHPVTIEMQNFYRPEKWMKGSEASAHLLTTEYSKSRYKRIEKLLSEKAPTTPDDALKILADDGVCNKTTVKSNIFDPANLTVYCAVRKDGEGPPAAKGTLVPIRLFPGGVTSCNPNLE